MKNLFYISLIISLVALLSACEPLEDREGVGTLITSADQLQATVTPIQYNGQNTNKVMVHCTSPVVCQWTDGVKTYISNDTVMTLFITGTQTISLRAMASDGSLLNKDYSIKVDVMKYPVEPQYGYFCGSGTKTWTWASSACFGNGHAYAWDPVNIKPEWWVLNPSDVTGQASDKGLPKEGAGATMKFTLSGLKLSRIDADGKVISNGTFAFAMAPDGHNWSTGTLTLTGTNILFGYDVNGNNAPWSQYAITFLDNTTMMLGAAEHSGSGTYWFWVFKAQ